MGAIAGILICGTYCAGLLVMGVLVRYGGLSLGQGVLILSGIAWGMAGVAAWGMPRVWFNGPRCFLWLSLGAIATLATVNYAWQSPRVGPLDISDLLNQGEAAGAQQVVTGRIEATPKLTRTGRGQFWLTVDQVRRIHGDVPSPTAETRQGKLYVTVPAPAIEGLYPGQPVTVEGRLYAPSAAKNPNAFDFQQYLASQGSFAGFAGQSVRPDSTVAPPRWALWRLRQRIVSAHRQHLGEDFGSLVSAMALGRRAAQVPYDWQDKFVQAGLAHTLAASGFHVSLVLGLVLGLLNRPAIATRSPNPGLTKLIVGSAALGGYVLLTGGQPSVLRAALMGLGALVGLALDRRVRPLGCLLLAATLLLLWNPTWIDDIGFRLSVMATLGLMVSVRPITDRLSWLPTTLAPLVAVPLAAYLWTIPLSLHYFNTLTTYSILLNVIATPLVMVISLGGILSGLVALLVPSLGGLLAWGLWLPMQSLLWLVNWETSLPGSAVATGHISIAQMYCLYGLFWLGGWQPWWRSRRWLVGLLLVLIALGPLWYKAATLTRITVLASGQDAILVLQTPQSSLLINSGTQENARYTVLPFLRQAGINRLTYALALAHSDRDNWQLVSDSATIKTFYQADGPLQAPTPLRQALTLAVQQPATLGSNVVEALTADANVLRLTLQGQHSWLLLWGQTALTQQRLQQSPLTLKSEVLWWDGSDLNDDFIAAVDPQVAIASTRQLNPSIKDQLLRRGIQVFCTEEDGAVLWQPRQGYRAYLQSTSISRAPLD